MVLVDGDFRRNRFHLVPAADRIVFRGGGARNLHQPLWDESVRRDGNAGVLALP